MPQLIFTLTINTETQEATFAGNMEAQVALQVLQQIVIADAISKAKETPNKPKAKSKTKEG